MWLISTPQWPLCNKLSSTGRRATSNTATESPAILVSIRRHPPEHQICLTNAFPYLANSSSDCWPYRSRRSRSQPNIHTTQSECVSQHPSPRQGCERLIFRCIPLLPVPALLLSPNQSLPWRWVAKNDPYRFDTHESAPCRESIRRRTSDLLQSMATSYTNELDAATYRCRERCSRPTKPAKRRPLYWLHRGRRGAQSWYR